ncbi:helix-turn-helix domain-containing protein [Streptomyces zhihengii]|uniref:helix-turn-helix domain-containing protein n=1 Tax=Streptomyces zhihengii TaxID=1818004 RepID=UPI0033AA19CA
MARSDASRTALLDAAERLFAESGIAQVSDRKIAEAAGNSNHSAVGYYFGGRDGMLRALLTRHLTGQEDGRRRYFDSSDSLLGDVRSLVLPATEELARLADEAGPDGQTWRARFVSAALHDPQTVAIYRELGDTAPVARAVIHSIAGRIDDLPAEVVRARAALMTHVITSTCAEYEDKTARERTVPDWRATGRFLADAIAGLLRAPVSTD